MPAPRSITSRPPPESFFVFVVGHCEEWPEGRDEQGDAAIYKEYLDFGVPADQCCYVKDDDCTRDNCQEQLESFLQTHQQQNRERKQEYPGVPDTLVVYYGGHGSAHGFCTIGGTWAYRDFAATVRNCFHGERVLLLIDCCASGNIWQHLAGTPKKEGQPESNATKEYALLSTSQPYIAATADGEEWILTNSWIQLMRRCRDDANDWSLDRVISLLADRYVLETGDLLYAYRMGEARRGCGAASGDESPVPWSWMPARNARVLDDVERNDSPKWLRLDDGNDDDDNDDDDDDDDVCGPIPSVAAMPPFHECRVGDALAYKHPGGPPRDTSGPRGYCVPPLWLYGRIVGTFERDRHVAEAGGGYGSSDCHVLRIRVWYPSRDREPWEVEVPHASRRLVNQFWVAQTWMMPRTFVKTQVMLAQAHCQYLDASVPPGTAVRVVGSQSTGETLREGRVMDWKDFAWKPLLLDWYRSGSTSTVLPGTTRYDPYYWNELPVPIKEAARILGYTKLHWDEDIPILADETDYDGLAEAQKEAATTLGYVRRKAPVKIELQNDKNNENNAADSTTNTESIASAQREVGKLDICAGPHVPVEWEGIDSSSSFVPLDQILFHETQHDSSNVTISSAARHDPSPNLRKRRIPSPESKNDGNGDDNDNDNDNCNEEKDPRQSLVLGLHASGKSIGDAASIFGTKELSAYWPDDERFHHATAIDLDDHGASQEPLLRLLATHFEYPMPGIYCPILYDNGEKLLVPVNHIYRRGCEPRPREDESDETARENKDERKTEHQQNGPEDSIYNGEIIAETTRNQPAASIPTQQIIDETTRSLDEVLARVFSWGEGYEEVASLLEAASSALPRVRSEAIAVPTTDNRYYGDEKWKDLPEHVQTAAKTLGYNRKIWDSDEYVSIDGTVWKDLTRDQKRALVVIGHNEVSWNAQNDEDENSDSDEDY